MKRQKDIAVIATSGIILVAFFLPWFKTGLFDAKGATASGYDLINLLFNISSSPELSRLPKEIYILFLLALYPICSIGLLYNEFRQKPGNFNFAKIMILIITILLIGGLIYMQNKLMHSIIKVSIFSFIGFGMYITIITSIVLFFTLFRKPVMVADDALQQNAHSTNSNKINDSLEQLEKLGKLKDQGLLSDEEFNEQKAKILQEQQSLKKQESIPIVQQAPIPPMVENEKETAPLEEKIGTNDNESTNNKSKTPMIIGISAVVILLGILLLYVFVFKKTSSVSAEEKAKIEQMKKDSLAKDSIAKANLVFDEKIIVGTWEGPFDKASIQLCITSIKNKQVEGYNIYKKNKRSISGSVENNGDAYHLVLKEPGDLKGDGEFTFDINKTDGEIIGSWKIFNGNLVREYRLTKQGESKTEQLTADAKALTIEGTNVNIRTTPSTKGAIVVQLNSGAICEIIEKGNMETIKGSADYWYKIRNNGKEGWVFGSFTSMKQ